jgi:hypothetical protein
MSAQQESRSAGRGATRLERSAGTVPASSAAVPSVSATPLAAVPWLLVTPASVAQQPRRLDAQHPPRGQVARG